MLTRAGRPSANWNHAYRFGAPTRPRRTGNTSQTSTRSVMPAIADIIAREILDSRGNPTVEVDVVLESGALGRAAVPSGASTGAHEAVELRDGDKTRYRRQGRAEGGRTMSRAKFSTRSPAWTPTEQVTIDNTMIDSTARRTRRGSARTRSSPCRWRSRRPRRDELGLPLYRYLGGVYARTLPVPMMNIVNGGKHADNPIDFQEFMIQPVAAGTIADAVRMGVGDVRRAEEGPARRRPQHQCRRRGRLRAQPEIGRRGARASSPRPARKPAIGRARTSPSRSTCASTEFFKDGKYNS